MYVLFLGNDRRVVGELYTDEPEQEYDLAHKVFDIKPDWMMEEREGYYKVLNESLDGVEFVPIPAPQPSQVDVLGQELTQMKIKDMQQQTIIDGLGKELTNAKIEIMQLKGGQTV